MAIRAFFIGKINLLAAVVEWVEKGIMPNAIERTISMSDTMAACGGIFTVTSQSSQAVSCFGKSVTEADIVVSYVAEHLSIRGSHPAVHICQHPFDKQSGIQARQTTLNPSFNFSY